uniref:Uncharacterized protein n=1 Tax=Onchocerca volvulus TaxID=6282 RepID=A0A8R1XR92_ONCVO
MQVKGKVESSVVKEYASLLQCFKFKNEKNFTMPTLLRIDWWSMETGYNSFHLLKANVRESERRRRGDEIELLSGSHL